MAFVSTTIQKLWWSWTSIARGILTQYWPVERLSRQWVARTVASVATSIVA